jgi:molecular chaperone GrpE (heat shock protein)
MEMDILAIIGIVAATSTVLTTIITLLVTKRNRNAQTKKTGANASETMGDAWVKLFAEMKVRQSFLESRIEILEKELAAKDKIILRLQNEIETLREKLELE